MLPFLKLYPYLTYKFCIKFKIALLTHKMFAWKCSQYSKELICARSAFCRYCLRVNNDKRSLFILRDDRCSMNYNFGTIIHIKLQFNLPAKRFCIRVFLFLVYRLATAYEHSLPGFDELLFVWSQPFDHLAWATL